MQDRYGGRGGDWRETLRVHRSHRLVGAWLVAKRALWTPIHANTDCLVVILEGAVVTENPLSRLDAR